MVVPGLIDACPGPDGSLTWALEQCGVRVLSNCPDPTAAGQCFFHPLLPSAYSWLRKSGGCDGFVMHPPGDLLELVPPLAVRAARKVVCCLIPGHWPNQVQGPIAAWLWDLDQDGRVLVVYGRGEGPSYKQAARVVIFRTALARRLMCRKGLDRTGLLGKSL